MKLIKNVMIRLLMKSANMLPVMGTGRYALTEGAYFSVIACMFAPEPGVLPAGAEGSQRSERSGQKHFLFGRSH